MSNWIICAGSVQASSLKRYLAAFGAMGEVTVEANPWVARELLRANPLRWSVMVSEGLSKLDAINVAAACALEACAQEVVLVVHDASGSMRSRAKRAGISRVLSFDEVEIAGVSASSKKDKRLASGDLPSIEVLEEQEAPAEKQVSARENHLQRRVEVPVVAFASGRGGVGKTTLCALAGLSAASWGMRVALLDLDLAFGNLASLCGASHSGDLSQIKDGVQDSNALEACSVAVSDNLNVVGPCCAPEYAELVQPYIPDIVAALSMRYDAIFVDTSNSWGEVSACIAQLSDRLILVTDERAGALPALVRCSKLAQRLGVARTRIIRAINGCDPRRRDEEFITRVALSPEGSREIRIFDGDLDAIELLNCGKASELIGLDNPLSNSVKSGIAQILQELGALPDDEAAQRALKGKSGARRFFGKAKQVSAA